MGVRSEPRERPLAGRHVLVAGGAGFLGSHLCHRLVRDGAAVVCLDNLSTGNRENVAELTQLGDFKLIEGDVTHPLPAEVVGQPFHRIYNMACIASPQRYQADPEHTLLTSKICKSLCWKT